VLGRSVKLFFNFILGLATTHSELRTTTVAVISVREETTLARTTRLLVAEPETAPCPVKFSLPESRSVNCCDVVN
jgi:hypothetical protein